MTGPWARALCSRPQLTPTNASSISSENTCVLCTALLTRYYHPSNLTISIVGDVDQAAVQQLAERYFGGWTPSGGAITLRNNLQQLALEPLPQPMSFAAASDQHKDSERRFAAVATYGSIKTSSPSSSTWRWSGVAEEFVQKSAAGPLLTMGYYRPSITGRVGTALEVRSMLATLFQIYGSDSAGP